MGLFGVRGTTLRWTGSPQERQPARALLEVIGGDLEKQLHDTPSEYLVLQAAGMHAALELGAVKNYGEKIDVPDPSIEGTLRLAKQILASYKLDRPITAQIRTKSQEVAFELLQAVRTQEVSGKSLIGNLDELLSFLESNYLQQS